MQYESIDTKLCIDMQISRKKARNPVEKVHDGYPNRQFTEEGTTVIAKCIKTCSNSPVIREPRWKLGTTLDSSD